MVAATSETVKSNPWATVWPYVLALAAGAAIFLMAYDGGSYSLESRSTVAIAALWAVLIGVVLALWPLATPPRAAWVAGALLAGFAAWTGASILWAESAERAFTEFNRVVLFVAVFLVAVFAGTRGNVGRWLDGIAVGIVATTLCALASRLFLDVLPQGQVPEFLPGVATRLSYPVEYWNGLAIFAALSIPLLLRAATVPQLLLWRALAVGVIPALVSAMYLTSSRGGFAAAFVAVAVFVTLTPRRWAAVGAIAVAGAASAFAISALVDRVELANGPFDAEVAVDQGRSFALLIVVTCVATGIVYALGARFLEGRVAVPRVVGRVAAAIAVLALVAGAVAADPVQRFETFKEFPEAQAEPTDLVRAHLTSGTGSGRWQFWTVAAEQFKGKPLIGMGAGSYESYWAEHTPISFFVRDAHSLYVETLGELGLVGLVLIGGALLVGLVSGVRRLRFVQGEERFSVAGLLAGFGAYLLGVGIDWMWELTVVSLVGITLLGFLTGPATAPALRPRLLAQDGRPPRGRRFAVTATALVAGWLLVCAQAVPFLAQIKISDSQAATRTGDGERALEDAAAARNLQPWAASPYLQVALVHEALGDPALAEEAIQAAIDRDPRDWRLWLAASRIHVQAGNVSEARTRLERAAELNPRSPLFANVR